MGQRILVVALLLITGAYAWGLLWIGVGFARSGGAVGWGLALGVLFFLVLSVWAIWRELLFGFAAARLSRLYEGPEGGGAAEPRAEFEAARTAIDEGARSWEAWFRLGLAYDALRDRRHARATVRRAIALESGRAVDEDPRL